MMSSARHNMIVECAFSSITIISAVTEFDDFFANGAHNPYCFSNARIFICHIPKLFLPENLSIFTFISNISLTQIKTKALIPISYNGCEKEQMMNVENNKEHTDLTWFTNDVLAMSTGRRQRIALLISRKTN